jgi:hypothetical protein
VASSGFHLIFYYLPLDSYYRGTGRERVRGMYIRLVFLTFSDEKQGEIFALRFTFTDRYPMESPEVVFVVNEEFQAPLHPHVYSNGHVSLIRVCPS